MLWRTLVSIFYLDQLRILESWTFMNELQWYFNETSIICFRNMPSAYCSHILWGLIWVLIHINTLRPRQNGRHFPDDKCILLNENVWVSIKISLKIFLNGFINNIPALVQIMVWRRGGDKSLSEPMMVSLLTDICVTRPQWVKWFGPTGSNCAEYTDITKHCCFRVCNLWCDVFKLE